MPPALTEDQYAELNLAVLGYLSAQNTPPNLIEDLCTHLNTSSSIIDDDNILERKWGALARLQKRIVTLETQLKTTNELLKSAKESANSPPPSNASSPLDNWLPKWPPAYTLLGHRAKVNCVAMHPHWSMAASGSDDGSIKIWNPENGELERTVYAHTRSVNAVCFAPLSGVLVSGSADSSVRIWDPAKQMANTLTLVGHDHTVSAISITFDPSTKKEYILSGSRDQTIRVWDLQTGFLFKVIKQHTDWVRTLATTQFATGDQQYVLSGGSDRSLRLTNIFGPEKSQIFNAHKHVVECCGIAPLTSKRFIRKNFPINDDDIIFASAGRDSRILIWSSANSEPLMKLKGHDNWIQGLHFHPNGRFLFSVSDDKTLRIWDLVSGKQVKHWEAHDHFVSCISGLKTTLITGSVDQSVRIWR